MPQEIIRPPKEQKNFIQGANSQQEQTQRLPRYCSYQKQINYDKYAEGGNKKDGKHALKDEEFQQIRVNYGKQKRNFQNML